MYSSLCCKKSLNTVNESAYLKNAFLKNNYNAFVRFLLDLLSNFILVCNSSKICFFLI